MRDVLWFEHLLFLLGLFGEALFFPQDSSLHRSGFHHRDVALGLQPLLRQEKLQSAKRLCPQTAAEFPPQRGAGGLEEPWTAWEDPREAVSAEVEGQPSSGPAKISHMIPL